MREFGCGCAEERDMGLAVIPEMTETSLFAAQALDACTAKGIALDLTKGSFYLGYPRRIVFVLVFESEDVAILDARGLLETLDG